MRSFPASRLILTLGLVGMAGCDSLVNSGTALDGTWHAVPTVPGSSVVVTLTGLLDTIEGTGTFSREAGDAGTINVSGSVHGSQVLLHLVYSDSSAYDFTGTMPDPQHLVGSVTMPDPQSGSIPITFER